MASRHARIGFLEARALLEPAFRTLNAFFAVMGIAISLELILFSFTVHCIIPAGSTKYLGARIAMAQFDKSLQKYRLDCGEYPIPRAGLQALLTNPGVKGWNGPYFKGRLRDPWDRPFLYEISGNVPIVRSLGADGKPGGDLFDADLSSQAPFAPIPESSFHATRAFFNFWIAPWLVLTASVYVLIRACSRTAPAPTALRNVRADC
jgi:type II secretion system protein G